MLSNLFNRVHVGFLYLGQNEDDYRICRCTIGNELFRNIRKGFALGQSHTPSDGISIVVVVDAISGLRRSIDLACADVVAADVSFPLDELTRWPWLSLSRRDANSNVEAFCKWILIIINSYQLLVCIVAMRIDRQHTGLIGVITISVLAAEARSRAVFSCSSRSSDPSQSMSSSP